MIQFFLASTLLFAASGRPMVDGPAPAFEGETTEGTLVKSEDLKGSWVVLYFYPKAFTPGCTAEACSLRDGFADLQAAGVRIFGVSLDDPKTLKKFKTEYRLPFDLISDRGKAISRAYDALGIGGLVASRRTFIIDPRGRIAHIFDKVNTKSHDREVLEVVKKLKEKA